MRVESIDNTDNPALTSPPSERAGLPGLSLTEVSVCLIILTVSVCLVVGLVCCSRRAARASKKRKHRDISLYLSRVKHSSGPRFLGHKRHSSRHRKLPIRGFFLPLAVSFIT